MGSSSIFPWAHQSWSPILRREFPLGYPTGPYISSCPQFQARQDRSSSLPSLWFQRTTIFTAHNRKTAVALGAWILAYQGVPNTRTDWGDWRTSSPAPDATLYTSTFTYSGTPMRSDSGGTFLLRFFFFLFFLSYGSATLVQGSLLYSLLLACQCRLRHTD